MLNGFLSQNRLLMAHTEGITGVQLRHFSPTCAVLVVVWLSQLSNKALAAQARCLEFDSQQTFHFLLFLHSKHLNSLNSNV